MFKRFIFIPLTLLFLGIAFIVINLLVKIIFGNSGLIKKKLFLGSLIITITAILNTPGWSQENKDVLHNPTIEFYTQGKPDITIQLPFEYTIQGRIQSPTSEYYSFKVTDLNDNFIENGRITATDGIFNSTSEEINFTITAALAPGRYRLYIYNTVIDTLKLNQNLKYIGLYVLTVTESDIMCYMYMYNY